MIELNSRAKPKPIPQPTSQTTPEKLFYDENGFINAPWVQKVLGSYPPIKSMHIIREIRKVWKEGTDAGKKQMLRSKTLRDAFLWDATPQGFHYWKNIHNEVW